MTDVDTYLAACRPVQAAALQALRAQIKSRQPGPKVGMVAGCAAFTHHLGLCPHSGSVIPRIDRTPFKTSKSGVLFTPDTPLPDLLLQTILSTRLAELAAGSGAIS